MFTLSSVCTCMCMRDHTHTNVLALSCLLSNLNVIERKRMCPFCHTRTASETDTYKIVCTRSAANECVCSCIHAPDQSLEHTRQYALKISCIRMFRSCKHAQDQTYICPRSYACLKSTVQTSQFLKDQKQTPMMKPLSVQRNTSPDHENPYMPGFPSWPDSSDWILGSPAWHFKCVYRPDTEPAWKIVYVFRPDTEPALKFKCVYRPDTEPCWKIVYVYTLGPHDEMTRIFSV